jgi:hypothetical protein
MVPAADGTARQLLEDLGHQLADDDEWQWRQFLGAYPDLAQRLGLAEQRWDEMARSDPPPPEFCPKWPEHERRQFWACAADRETRLLEGDIIERWLKVTGHDLDTILKPFTAEELDGTSYLLFLDRLPDPGA